MAELPKRIGAFILAMLFLVTSAGLTIVIIWQAAQQNKNNSGQDQAAQKCQFTSVEAETLPDPEVYKPAGEVTEIAQEDLVVGTGAEAKQGDCLVVKYHGTLASDGKKFDSNFDQPLGLQFPLGTGQVIPGWDIGLVGMKEGGTRRLVIPANLAYGEQASGEIPANSALVFVVKLEKATQE